MHFKATQDCAREKSRKTYSSDFDRAMEMEGKEKRVQARI